MALKVAPCIRFSRLRLLSSRLTYCSCSDVPASRAYLAIRIFKWASSQRIFAHTVDTYACMISRLGVVGDCDEMDSLLKEMIKLNAPKLDKILNDLVQLLSRRNRCDEALLVIQNACSGKLKMPVSSCNAVLCGLVREGRGLRPFIRAYMDIVKAGVLPDVETLNW
jgi:pentatricopeptide repeat protein